MATDMFLKLDGIKGESKDAKHPGEVDVLAWSWGLSNTGTFHKGTGGGGGKASFNDISFTKWIDAASCALMTNCASGAHIKKATLTVRKAGGKAPLEYLVINLENILVSSYSTGGSGGEDLLTENVTLNFAKVKIEYQKQKDDGSGEKAGNFGWDIAANKSA